MTLCYIKWITDLLEQSISLGLFTLLCYILKPNENPVYIFDKELNQSVGIKDNGSNNHNSNSVSNNNDNVTKLDDDSNNHSVNESDKDNENKFKVDIKENENK